MCWKNNILLILFFSIITFACNSQDKKDSVLKSDRQPVVAGSFYPNDPKELKAELESLFNKAEKGKTSDPVLAIIAPHAGYIYSGKVAASAYSQIDPNKEYENIFILASSHRIVFRGASIYNIGDYITPLGKVKVNQTIANQLIEKHEVFVFNPEAHAAEHSLEVQLPFLQYYLKKDFTIVPIVTGTQYLDDCEQIAEALIPYFNEKNLFIISSDFSHYPSYDDAVKVDKKTCDAILQNSVAKLIHTINENGSGDFNNLATSLCGWPAVISLLFITESMPGIKPLFIDYQNSGDETKDKNRVVGYNAIIFTKKNTQNMPETNFKLTKKEEKELLVIARNTIETYLQSGKIPETNESQLTPSMKENCGAFVTLHKDGALRGCIGRFSTSEPLYKVVQQMAIAAATEDHRFSVVTVDEMKEIDVEISVLTPMRKINSIEEIEMGKHGIYIKKGFYSGTFLPQVATETGWTKEEFLGNCSKNKAGLGWDGWKDAEIFIYEALVFGEKDF
ncbi:MAG: AmmeMemoRadiSam system protein B [Bacteroidales bacterium]